MKCPKCGEEMEEGFVFPFSPAGSHSIVWSQKEPKDIGWMLGFPKEWTKLAERYILTDRKKWLRKGFRCPNCRLVTFEY